MVAVSKPQGTNYADPSIMVVRTVASSALHFINASAGDTVANTTAAFTGFAQFGLQDNTDWTANTYKTIYSHTGAGLIYAMVGPTAGGAETTTFEITIDGKLQTMTVTNANGERAVLAAADMSANNVELISTVITTPSALDASLTTFQTSANAYLLPVHMHHIIGLPVLQYSLSCLIRMKHSTIITNSTATAYSAVLVRKRLAA